MNPMDFNVHTDSLQWRGESQANKLQSMQAQYLHPDSSDQKKLKKAAQEFEGIFVQQLLDAMDKTVDRKDSILSGGSAEQYFRSMLNEEIAKSMSTGKGGSGFGMAEAIYRQLNREAKPAVDNTLTGPTMGQTNEVKH